MRNSKHVKIASRASPLAMAQSNYVADYIRAQGIDVDIISFSTKGDRILNQALTEIGGKGLFTQELDAALRKGTVDMAVHSLKDMPTQDMGEFTIAAIPPREDARDVLILAAPPRQSISDPMHSLDLLENGAHLGTASLRRQMQIRYKRPDIRLDILRGNVATRLQKLRAPHGPDATLLAYAGLKRLNMTTHAHAILPVELMLPAAGQGALCIQVLRNNVEICALLEGLHDAPTATCVRAERSFLAAIQGSCQSPIAAYAYLKAGHVHLTVRLLSMDGQQMAECKGHALHADAAQLGTQLAAQIRQEAPHLVGHA